jgi:hypothetical protein
MKRPPRRITHLLHAWPADAQPSDTASVVVHVRGGDRLQQEIADLKARGLSKVLVAPLAANDGAWWA